MKVKHYKEFSGGSSNIKKIGKASDISRTGKHFFVGIDIEEAQILSVVVDGTAKIIGRNRSARTKKTLKNTLPEVIACVNKMLADAKIDKADIKTVGLGLADKNLASLAKPIQKELGAELFFGSSARCAAYAEIRMNPKANVSRLLYMHSDLGQGVVFEKGECREAAAEENFKKYLMPWDETLGIAQSARNEVSRGIGTKIVNLAEGDVEKISKEVVIEAARENDEVASDIIKSVAINIGIRIAYLINLIGPDAIIIGDGVKGAGDLVLDPVMSMAKKLALTEHSGKVKILLGELGEEASALGAALLAASELYTW